MVSVILVKFGPHWLSVFWRLCIGDAFILPCPYVFAELSLVHFLPVFEAWLWVDCLVLNDVAVSPMLIVFSSLEVATFASYTMFLAVHFPGRYKSAFCFWVYFRMFEIIRSYRLNSIYINTEIKKKKKQWLYLSTHILSKSLLHELTPCQSVA